MSRTATRTRKHAISALLALAATTIASLLLGAGAAQAQAYRYWSLWNSENGAWAMAQTGPDQIKTVDKLVQGWRFAISPETGGPGPRTPATYDALCPGAAEPAAGQVRVAVVLDAGFTADAPQGDTPFGLKVSCVEVAEGTNGYTALAATGSVHQENGLVCGINGYPTKECGAAVTDDVAKTAAAAASAEPTPVLSSDAAGSGSESSGTPWGLIAGAGVAAALVLGLLVARSRRTSTSTAPGGAGPDAGPDAGSGAGAGAGAEAQTEADPDATRQS